MSSVERATERLVRERPGNRSLPPARSGRALVSRKHVEIVLLLAPALLLYVLFVLYPVVESAHYSFYKWNGLEPLTNFVGLDNYTKALQDPVFTDAIKHNAIFIVLSLVIQLPLGIGLALILNRKMIGRSTLRMIVFAPYILAEVTTGVAWSLMMAPDQAVDTLLRDLGLGSLVREWLSDPDIVLYSLFLVITWKYIGFAVILFLAGLQGIPKELIEAAKIDGANAWQLARRITIPLIGPTVRIWIFLSIIGSLQLFDLIKIMTNGAPGNASNTMVLYLYHNGFERTRFGYGSAASVILFIISFIFALIYQRYVLRRDTEGALTRRVG